VGSESWGEFKLRGRSFLEDSTEGFQVELSGQNDESLSNVTITYSLFVYSLSSQKALLIFVLSPFFAIFDLTFSQSPTPFDPHQKEVLLNLDLVHLQACSIPIRPLCHSSLEFSSIVSLSPFLSRSSFVLRGNEVHLFISGYRLSTLLHNLRLRFLSKRKPLSTSLKQLDL